MMLDQSMLDFHDFHQLDLVAIGRLPRILPHQNPLTVGEPIVGPVPTHKLVRSAARTFLEEGADLPMPPQDAAASCEDRRNQRRLEDGILRIEGNQTVGI